MVTNYLFGGFMIVQKELLSKLKDFGLNSYEAKLWTALLSRGVATAGELSDIANVPRSRSYDVLESLEKKGFVILKLGKPIKYIAVSPEEVVERVKKSIDEEAQKQAKLVDSLKNSEVLGELKSLHSQNISSIEPVDLTGAIKGRNNLYTHLSSMIKNASKEVLIMTTSSGVERKATALKSALNKAKNSGVKVRIIAPVNSKNEEFFKQLSKLAVVKAAPSDVNARFCVVDGSQISFMVVDDEKVHPTYDFGVWVNTPLFTKTFSSFFEQQWKDAKPLK